MSKLSSCLNLSLLLPISKLEKNINAISSLIYNEDETLDSFLQKVDQPLIINLQKKGGFICCEFNRDGDSYRIPGTNEYLPQIEDGNLLKEKFLQLEIEFNKIFRIYTNFYYSTNAICSVYVYPIDENNDDEFVVSALISHSIEGENNSKGKWETTNLCTINVDYDNKEVSYNLITSVVVYLNSNIKTGINNNNNNNNLNLGGSLMKNVKKNVKFKDNIDDQFHITNVGNLIEDLETNICSEIEVIYFQKTIQIIDSARINSERENLLNNLRNIIK